MTPRPFTIDRRLTWGEADPAGTIYAPRAFDLAIQAVEALWREALGLSFRDWQEAHGRGAPWVHLEADFLAPLMAGDHFTLAVAIARLGTSSITYRVEAAGAGGQALFRLTLVEAIIDRATMKATPLPESFRSGLAPYVIAA